MAKRSLERSKFGRLLASYITFHNADPTVLRKVDTIDLVRWLEHIVRMMEAFAAILAADRRGAQKGDRRALVEYLKDLKHPITPDIRAHIIEILSGKQRSANRPRRLPPSKDTTPSPPLSRRGCFPVSPMRRQRGERRKNFVAATN